MSTALQRFKNEICDRHLLKIEDRIREIWPDSHPYITLIIRTPWLGDGGILISNDSLKDAEAELHRLGAKEPSK